MMLREKLPRRLRDQKQKSVELTRRDLDQLRHLERAFSNLMSHLWAMQYSLGPQLYVLSPLLEWALVIGCLWVIPALHNKTHGSPSWILVVPILWSVMESLSGVITHCISPEKVLSYNIEGDCSKELLWSSDCGCLSPLCKITEKVLRTDTGIRKYLNHLYIILF